jgi:hypothetical protein
MEVENGGLMITPKSSPTIPFFEWEMPLTLQQILAKPWHEIPDFAPCGPFPSPDDPFLLVKATRLACGSVAMGFCFHHTVADAHSMFYFIRDWSKLHRGLPIDPPINDRDYMIPAPGAKPLFDHPEYKIVKPSTTKQEK